MAEEPLITVLFLVRVQAGPPRTPRRAFGLAAGRLRCGRVAMMTSRRWA